MLLADAAIVGKHQEAKSSEKNTCRARGYSFCACSHTVSELTFKCVHTIKTEPGLSGFSLS